MADAHTLADTNPSTKVLEKIGMRKIGTAHDPDEGEVWHWRLTREDYML
jgi:RimJ/RimL family protein N-acetyltransferase